MLQGLKRDKIAKTVLSYMKSRMKTFGDQDLIEQGTYFLNVSAQGGDLSSYHLEAGIAFWNCQKEDTKEKRESILHHYDLLLEINYSPGVALNRVYALIKLWGKNCFG